VVDVPWSQPLRVLAYGDSNTWGFVSDAGTGNPARLPDPERWPGIVEAALGGGVQVLVDAIPGRRTDRDADADLPILDSVAPSALNGLQHAEAAGLAHAPLDLVIVMLGTNDLAIVPALPVDDIARACVRVAQALVRGATAFTPGRVPQVLMVAPPPLGGDGGTSAELPLWPAIWQASRALGPALGRAAAAQGLHVLEGGSATSTSGSDRVHLDAEDHHRLGQAVAHRVRALLPSR
jgi:lysophospholipase L1-like esterase